MQIVEVEVSTLSLTAEALEYWTDGTILMWDTIHSTTGSAAVHFIAYQYCS